MAGQQLQRCGRTDAGRRVQGEAHGAARCDLLEGLGQIPAPRVQGLGANQSFRQFMDRVWLQA